MKPRPKSGKRARSVTEAHVRLYRHELECPAYRTLSPAARALLVELRALYSPATGDNRVYCGIRDVMKRCNLTQRAAAHARDELVSKGWVTIVQLGHFRWKARHATIFALENEAPNTGNGSQPGKAFMRWQPASNPPTRLPTEKTGSGIDYRSVAESTTDQNREGKKIAFTVAESTTETPVFPPSSVAESTTQIGLPLIGGFCSGADVPASAASVRAKRRRAA